MIAELQSSLSPAISMGSFHYPTYTRHSLSNNTSWVILPLGRRVLVNTMHLTPLFFPRLEYSFCQGCSHCHSAASDADPNLGSGQVSLGPSQQQHAEERGKCSNQHKRELERYPFYDNSSCEQGYRTADRPS